MQFTIRGNTRLDLHRNGVDETTDASVVASSKNNPDILEQLKNQAILLDWNYLPIVAEGKDPLAKFLTLAMNGR